MEAAARLVLLAGTLIAVTFWANALREARRKGRPLLPEQRWISVALVGLVLLLDPFAIPRLLHGGVFGTLSMASYAVALGTFLAFWLCIVDGLRPRPARTHPARRAALLPTNSAR